MPRGNRSPRRGHPPKRGPDEKFVSRRITLPPLVDAAVVGLQEGEEGFSTTLARVLRSHPAVSATMEEWIERTPKQQG